MTQELASVLLGTLGLWLVAAAAALLVRMRGAPRERPRALRSAQRAAAVAVLCQAAHAVEELATGFATRFPELLGLVPWPRGFFETFNALALALFAASIWRLPRASRAALFVLWFLALAGLANAVAHALFALAVGGYFPGLFSAPLVGVAGAALARSLLEISEASR